MISFVTPTFNEKEAIQIFVKTMTDFGHTLNRPFEIIVVDDNSPDGTSEIVQKLQTEYPHLKLLKRIGKKGIGSAYYDGYHQAQGEIIIGLDADLSQSLKTIPQFLSMIENEGYDMVIGSRNTSESVITGCSAFKRFGSITLNYFIRFFLGIHSSDLTHSFRAFKKEVLSKMNDQKITEIGHPSFFIEFSYRLTQEGYKIGDTSCDFKEREVGYSKLNLVKGLKRALHTMYRLKFS
jgi:dolichol-phosphate mannosyltransferase